MSQPSEQPRSTSTLRGLRYQLFPRSVGLTAELRSIIEAFESVHSRIRSSEYRLNSNGVLQLLRPSLERLGFRIETGKSKGEKIPVPVLFGLNNRIDRAFDADGVSGDGRIVLEVEAGRAVVNYQFLKDIFQACMMHGVEYLVLAVRNDYRGNDDFHKVYSFLETLYISSRIQLPLRGIVVIGY
jgi:hypothetical protein